MTRNLCYQSVTLIVLNSPDCAKYICDGAGRSTESLIINAVPTTLLAPAALISLTLAMSQIEPNPHTSHSYILRPLLNFKTPSHRTRHAQTHAPNREALPKKRTPLQRSGPRVRLVKIVTSIEGRAEDVRVIAGKRA